MTRTCCTTSLPSRPGTPSTTVDPTLINEVCDDMPPVPLANPSTPRCELLAFPFVVAPDEEYPEPLPLPVSSRSGPPMALAARGQRRGAQVEDRRSK